MTLGQVVTILNGELLTPDSNLEMEIVQVFASDLMSDVLAFMQPGSLLLTGLVNHHAVCTACLADVSAVVFVQGKRPAAEVVDQAKANSLPIICTSLPMFGACAALSRTGFGQTGLAGR
jgi:predicted transcriptional regulator